MLVWNSFHNFQKLRFGPSCKDVMAKSSTSKSKIFNVELNKKARCLGSWKQKPPQINIVVTKTWKFIIPQVTTYKRIG